MKFYYLTYTDKVKGGSQFGPVIKINPKYKNDKGIHEHEIEHVRHFYVAALIGLTVWSFIPFGTMISASSLPILIMSYHLLYRIPHFQLFVEIICYREQLKYYSSDKMKQLAEVVVNSDKYSFRVSKQKFMEYLSGKRKFHLFRFWKND